MRFTSVVQLWLFLFGSMMIAMGQNAAQKQAEARQEVEQLALRFQNPQSINLITSQMWALTHAGRLKNEVDESMELLASFLDKASKNEDAGSAKEFKSKMAAFLNSKDDIVAGFAASVLGISGDLSYAPRIAKLLDKEEPPDDQTQPITSRGRAAVALSLMGAREYIPKLVLMLKSRNDYDRRGAAVALGQLHAKEYANEVASLLRPENRGLRVDDSPIYALMEMGVGPAHAADFARVLHNNFDPETTKAAAFALAKLGAKEYKQDIAKLLGHEFLKGDAAKVLALMGATEYVEQIASLLKDRNGLTRTDALLSLGIMRATKYVPQVAKHLKDPEVYVPIHAAYALVLMEADQYADQILPEVEHLYREDLFLGEDRFHPFAEDEIKKIKNRFKESFFRMKAKRERQKAVGELMTVLDSCIFN
jgi:HEAT repeat protein